VHAGLTLSPRPVLPVILLPVFTFASQANRVGARCVHNVCKLFALFSVAVMVVYPLLVLLAVLCFFDPSLADPITDGLLDPDAQPKFVEPVTEALSSSFKIILSSTTTEIGVYSILHETGLVDGSGVRLTTPVFGYGTSQATASWPGPTLEAQTNVSTKVRWLNMLFDVASHPFTSLVGERPVVDTTNHWAYSAMGYQTYTIEQDGIPIVTHLHGSRSGPDLDGNPEHFFSPGFGIVGPDWKFDIYEYPNDQPAGALWYHDHTLGITRLNVYAGLSGHYFIRDDKDTGRDKNKLRLPSGEYEKAYVIQDRMFKANGELFYPAYEGEPGYTDYITGEGATWDPAKPTGLAEFFGDFMMVNGKAWPQQTVKNHRYRLRLLNGCDSRFLAIRFVAVKAGATSIENGTPVPFTLVGADQGLLDKPIRGVTRSLIEVGARLDIVINFRGLYGKRIIMVNEGGDIPFSGDLPGDQLYTFTSMVMAFDVTKRSFFNIWGPNWQLPRSNDKPTNLTRRVGLFEGRDSFGRIEPLQGGVTQQNVLETLTWRDQTTETPKVGTTEEWEIYNFSEDAVCNV
jgi:spore coat protein A, manganese oxidase